MGSYLITATWKPAGDRSRIPRHCLGSLHLRRSLGIHCSRIAEFFMREEDLVYHMFVARIQLAVLRLVIPNLEPLHLSCIIARMQHQHLGELIPRRADT